MLYLKPHGNYKAKIYGIYPKEKEKVTKAHHYRQLLNQRKTPNKKQRSYKRARK
jgi:hypothetical protein